LPTFGSSNYFTRSDEADGCRICDVAVAHRADLMKLAILQAILQACMHKPEGSFQTRF
jgi:hypothetical protein